MHDRSHCCCALFSLTGNWSELQALIDAGRRLNGFQKWTRNYVIAIVECPRWSIAPRGMPEAGTGVSRRLEKLPQSLFHQGFFRGFSAARQPVVYLPYADGMRYRATNFDLEDAGLLWFALMLTEGPDSQDCRFVHAARIYLDAVSQSVAI